MSESLLSKTFLTSYVTMQELARTLERELAAEREKVRLLRLALALAAHKAGELKENYLRQAAAAILATEPSA